MDDATFREQFKPVNVPAAFDKAENFQDKVVFALAQCEEGTADAVISKLEELDPNTPDKQIIAGVHQVLSELYEKGLIAANEVNSTLVYNLHKITEANNGQVNPDLLAPGLD